MNELSAKAIVRNALEKDELNLLLLGSPAYRFLPRLSPAPGNTDLTSLIGWLYEGVEHYTQDELRDRLYAAIKKIVGTYEGLDPVATCVLMEASRRHKGKLTLGLPLEESAAELRDSIENYRWRLMGDKTGEGSLWQNGLLGDFQRLSKNTKKMGGPSFCE
jgi:hypothetical protein